MRTSAEFLTTFFNFLNKNGEYAVLRNFEGLPAHNNSRDIDIVIEPSTYRRLKSDLIELIEKEGWKIVTYLNSDRLITWVCACVDGDSRTEIVQFDFFFHTSIFGVTLLEAKDFLKDSSNPDGGNKESCAPLTGPDKSNERCKQHPLSWMVCFALLSHQGKVRCSWGMETS